MATVTLKSKTIHTNGNLPEKGDAAPDFILVGQDLTEVSLIYFGKKNKLLNIFPSMDTKTCSLAMRTFYEKCKEASDLAVLNISMDLPFAAARFCQENKLEQATTLSAFRSNFPEDYGLKINEGPLKGLCARAVIVLDENNRVVYSELVPEITQEPNYDAAINSLQKK